MKKLTDLGEDRLVARLVRGLSGNANVRVGPGDDCAVIGRARDREWQLLKTDCVIEDVHFLRSADANRVGWKALCRAISDIAAMGGEPGEALITIASPGTLDVAWLDGLYRGIRKAAKRFGVSVVGGETARSPGPIFINVALTGRVARAECVTRSGGRAGDVLFVTGRLGGSIRGRHLDFIPRVAEARWLVRHHRPTAMMDLSDGLAADLPRLAAASGCSFAVDLESVPCARGASSEEALSDGEDYELLFAVAPRTAICLESDWPTAFPRLPLTRIGRLTKLTSRNLPNRRGFDHFAPA